MAPAARPSLDECADLVEDAKRMFTSPTEDADQVLRMRLWQEDVFAAFKQRDNHMATLIREMTGRVSLAEKKACAPEPAEAHQRRIEDLEGEKRAYLELIDRFTADAQALEDEADADKNRAAAVRLAREQLDERIATEVPRLRNLLSLYAGSTKIGWLYEQTDRVRGRVTDATAGDVRPFDLDPAALSTVELADKLWELV